MNGRARAPGAGTILNALANGIGSAFAIDAYTTASVSITPSGPITGEVLDSPEADTALIKRCLELVIDHHGDRHGAHVATTSDIPIASGLKSSSAVANATVLAALAAFDAVPETTQEFVAAAKIGVQAARDVGVTVTGAFDDASASMLGGVTITDNRSDELKAREEVDWNVLVWTPPAKSYSADADVERCARIAPIADFIAETALAGDYAEAMTINGFVFMATLGFSADPLLEALPEATGVSLSGTGPSVTAIGDRDALLTVKDRWSEREGTTWLTTTQSEGAQIL